MKYIGTIHTKFSGNEKMPRQGRFSEDAEGYVEFSDKYTDGLLDLNKFYLCCP
jgi:tRNA (Thr-GGU) A37 N-methylase